MELHSGQIYATFYRYTTGRQHRHFNNALKYEAESESFRRMLGTNGFPHISSTWGNIFFLEMIGVCIKCDWMHASEGCITKKCGNQVLSRKPIRKQYIRNSSALGFHIKTLTTWKYKVLTSTDNMYTTPRQRVVCVLKSPNRCPLCIFLRNWVKWTHWTGRTGSSSQVFLLLLMVGGHFSHTTRKPPGTRSSEQLQQNHPEKPAQDFLCGATWGMWRSAWMKVKIRRWFYTITSGTN